MNATYLQARITATETAIAAYEAAVFAIGTNGAESYTMDTGQSRVVVTKINLAEMERVVAGLYNRLVTLQARLNGGTVLVVPTW